MRASMKIRLLRGRRRALFLRRRKSGLGGGGFGHALLELIHAASRIHKLLGARVERMARVANADDDARLCGAGLNHVAASATNLRIQISRMKFCFHKKGRSEYQQAT
jgi:hypothetical protein